ncbi:MAG: hypothetical protein BWY87_01304 [Deltaproteobacteria bacterium ADurb.Bin510]|nr:MAG: hypothetical protein BWY87_01304 [Deltaproteobacteria bacterium ADurb.Bin510]
MNRLATSTSPYLRQHAANPVDWQPWDAAALGQAKAEDKPIFVSIGYATCHWCHVMAHESFENQRVAAELNRCCVCIKVDREEMPQIDQLYMRACQLMTGSGGWPLNLALTPDGRPFFAATYIRPNSSFGQLGMLDLPARFAASWQEHRREVEARADQVVRRLKLAPTGGLDFGPALYEQSNARLKSAFDRQFGGFGAAPKFPSCHNLLFLLGCFEKQGDQAALEMVNQTLTAIRNGGIYDGS